MSDTEPVPSSIAYPPWVLRGLRRMMFRLANLPEIKDILRSYIREPQTPAVMARLRREIEAEVHRVRREEHVEEVPFYVHLDGRPEEMTGKVSLDLSIPLYKHDCDACRFLGRVTFTTWRGTETFDLYTCAKAVGGRTFIYRYGDDGADYSSCPAFALPQGPHPALFECVRRAHDDGLF